MYLKILEAKYQKGNEFKRIKEQGIKTELFPVVVWEWRGLVQ